MSLTTIGVAAATAVLGYNMLQNRPDVQSSGRNRTLRGIALTGSATIGDSAVDVKVGDRTVATMYNSKLLLPSADGDMFATAIFVPAGVPISVIVVDAPATSILYILLDV
jgi:hypothetical protein